MNKKQFIDARKKILESQSVRDFQNLIYGYYKEFKREFEWRNIENAYYVVVSEIMLQQTQTERVKEKYKEFITSFPTLEKLANAQTHEVIAAWQGLGYNRRALGLKAFAERVVSEYSGVIPEEPLILETFKGIGPATASSIAAFAFNKPTIFIETNIRAVYIHCFFAQQTDISDKELLPLIAQTLDHEDPRNWYYALMDYGVMLKKKFKNPSRKSAHHTVQSKFEGSNRQVRGLILKMLVATPYLAPEVFFETIDRSPDLIAKLLESLEQEGFIKLVKGTYRLS